eukprot:NODE_131_length_16689_cov_0.437914.p8 type:complete len:198 gc:universal NODE_131_length_16689_cov_0.437914:3814-4407(+)
MLLIWMICTIAINIQVGTSEHVFYSIIDGSIVNRKWQTLEMELTTDKLIEIVMKWTDIHIKVLVGSKHIQINLIRRENELFTKQQVMKALEIASGEIKESLINIRIQSDSSEFEWIGYSVENAEFGYWKSGKGMSLLIFKIDAVINSIEKEEFVTIQSTYYSRFDILIHSNNIKQVILNELKKCHFYAFQMEASKLV